MSLPLNKVGEEEGNFTSEINNCKGDEICGDLLEEELLRRSKDVEQVVITSSLLVASVFGEGKWSYVYRWVHSRLKGTHESLANQIEIEQAVKQLKRKHFNSTINLLKNFEEKETETRYIAATDLSFLYFIEKFLTLLKIIQILL